MPCRLPFASRSRIFHARPVVVCVHARVYTLHIPLDANAYHVFVKDTNTRTKVLRVRLPMRVLRAEYVSSRARPFSRICTRTRPRTHTHLHPLTHMHTQTQTCKYRHRKTCDLISAFYLCYHSLADDSACVLLESHPCVQ